MNKKGFTLIEVIAVVVILGLLMIIAIPAVTQYINSSDESVYVNNVSSFLQEAKLLYQEKEFGPQIEVGDIMVVPISILDLEKGNTTNSPFGTYSKKQSYILIKRTAKSYDYYATVVDSTNRGLSEVKEDELNNNVIGKVNVTVIPDFENLYDCNSESYIIDRNANFSFKGEAYHPVEYREYGDGMCTQTMPIIIVAK